MTKSPFVLKLICVAGVLLCCHCKKEDKVRPPLKEEYKCLSDTVVLMPQDLKDRFYFKEGTYWVYENTETHETDCMWVEKSRFRLTNIAGAEITNKCYESFYVTLQMPKYYTAKSYFLSIFCGPGYPESNSNLEQLFFQLEGANWMGDNAISRFYCRGDSYTNEYGAVLSFPDSLKTRHGLAFGDLIRFYYPMETPDDRDELVYSRHIGLVKFRKYSDQSAWELLRYHIEQ